MKKTLSVLLCAAALISVMALVATHAQAANAVISAQTDPSVEPTAAPTTTAASQWYENLADWWEEFRPTFVSLWQGGFGALSGILVQGFRFLLQIFALDLWNGGLLDAF